MRSKRKIIDPQLKVLNASNSQKNPTDGYYFVEHVLKGTEGQNKAFFLSAVPAEYGISGLNTYCIIYQDNQAKTLKKNNGGRPVSSISSIDNSWENL